MPETTELKKEKVSFITIPAKVLIIPIQVQGFRLGLESTKEKYQKVPGTSYAWEPSVKGHVYMTGLHYISTADQKRISEAIGRKLNDEFYMNMSYRMDASNPHGHHMDLSKPYEQLVYLAMLDSHLIARNLNQYKDGTKPEADWYMDDKEAEAELDAAEREGIVQAIQEFGKLSSYKKKAFAIIFELPVVGLSPKVAENLLWKKVMETKGKPGKVILKKFIEMCSWSDDKVNVHEEVSEAISKNIIRKNVAGDWLYGDDILGASKDQVIGKVMDGANQTLRAAIKAKLGK